MMKETTPNDKTNFCCKLGKTTLTTLDEARKFQIKIRKLARYKDCFLEKSNVLGLDIGYRNNKAYAAAVLVDIKTKQILEKKVLVRNPCIPYIPSYLFLREVPLYLELMKQLKNKPHITLVDGHGLAHPFFAGSATVLGILSDLPTIGVAKKPMKSFQFSTSDYDNCQSIIIKKREVGVSYHKKKNKKPLYISPGNKISIRSAISTVTSLLRESFRLPIPLYHADVLSKSKEILNEENE